jgi:rubredoxin
MTDSQIEPVDTYQCVDCGHEELVYRSEQPGRPIRKTVGEGPTTMVVDDVVCPECYLEDYQWTNGREAMLNAREEVQSFDG